MKRVLSVLLAAVLCAGMLTGCGGKPEDVSQDVYDLGIETCDVLDDYIQGKMKQNTCEEKLEEIADRARVLREDDSKTFNDGIILTYICLSPSNVSHLYFAEGETYEAENALEKLKEELNLK